MHPYKACRVFQPIREPIYIEIGCVCGNDGLGWQCAFEFGQDRGLNRKILEGRLDC